MARIVLKVGSAVLTQDNAISLVRMQALVDFIKELRNKNQVILVSSGAVSAGYTELQLDKKILKHKQALAAIGQPILMHKYFEKFSKENILCSQVLVTANNLSKKDDSKRIQDTIDVLLGNNVVPIVNENDATATQELEIGDNDQLSAYITKQTSADILVILSDIDAYYDKDPRKYNNASVVKCVTSIDPKELEKDSTAHNEFATGGIVTKLKAAKYLLDNNISMFLASGFDLSDIKSFLIDEKHIGGTLFKGES